MVELYTHVSAPCLPDLEAITQDDGIRHYSTPLGLMPSVTTVLGWYKERSGGLAAWRERVGEDEAERIRNASAEAGTDMHNCIEQFLCGWPLTPGTPRVRHLLLSLLPGLALIDNIRHIEAALHSPSMGIAGRTDTIGDYDGTLTVVDFKNSLRRKKREWVEGYVLQVTAYAKMYEELTGVPILQGAVLIGIAPGDGGSHENHQKFIVDTREHVCELRKIVHEYKAAHSV